MKMNKMNKHVVKNKEGDWAVKTAGVEQPIRTYYSKEEAIGYAKKVAKDHNVCMVVHDDKGKFSEFDCSLAMPNQHVVKRKGKWAVISAGGKEINGVFGKKGSALGYAYNLAAKNNVCMLVHGKNGKFVSKRCPTDGNPGILEVFKMRVGI